MSGQRINVWGSYLGAFLVFASICLPPVTLTPNTPSVHVLDFLLPIIVCFIVWKKTWESMRFYLWIPFVISGYVVLTIFLNFKNVASNDYFEVYKWLKYGCAFLFFTHIDFSILKRTIPMLFFIICVINILHFLEFPGLNQLLEKYYNGGLQIQFFGKDSQGGPAVKRLIGTMGNPNINAIMFGIFSIFYFPLRFERNRLAMYFLCILFVFLCQSRTALLVVIAMFSYVACVHSNIWTKKQWFVMLSGLTAAFLLAWMFSTSFFQYNSYNNSLMDGTILESGSARGRFETWKLLGEMILQNPLFGHGPYKHYFYQHHLYSENEYILMMWRYGLIGLGLYLSIFIIPFKKLWKRNCERSIKGSLLILLMLVSALTNNPFTERNIEVLFCVGLAWVIGTEFMKGKTHAEV
ncbi:MAG: O-antigen ligase family protein [Bacteroidota bacterium]